MTLYFESRAGIETYSFSTGCQIFYFASLIKYLTTFSIPSRVAKATQKDSFYKKARTFVNESRAGVEPAHGGFANRSVNHFATWT